jgi:hypothetical protein
LTPAQGVFFNWIFLGTGYMIDSFINILFPAYRSFSTLPALAFSAIGEVSMILWLLIKGVKVQKTDASHNAGHA